MDALALHAVFRTAVGTLIEDPVQTVCPEGNIDGDAVVPLPCEIVEGEGLVQPGIQLRNGQLLQLLGGGQALDVGADLHIPDLEHVVQGIPVEGALGDDRHHGNTQLLHQNAQLPGQGGGAAVEGVARLGVHQDAGLVGLEHVLHVLDQGQVGHILVGGGAAQNAHQLAEDAGHGVHGGDDSQGLGVENTVGQLHIREAAVVHQDQAGLVAHQLHPLGGIVEFGLPQGRRRADANHTGQKAAGHPGRPVLQAGQLQNFFIGQIAGVDLHKNTSCPSCLFHFTITRSQMQRKKTPKVFAQQRTTCIKL